MSGFVRDNSKRYFSSPRRPDLLWDNAVDMGALPKDVSLPPYNTDLTNEWSSNSTSPPCFYLCAVARGGAVG